MSDPKGQQTPAIRYAAYLRESHRLIREGLGDSPEAEDLSDRMDVPWYAMSRQEQDRMGGLSEDLYTLTDGLRRRIGWTAENAAAWRTELRDAWAAFQQGRVDTTLLFLRQPMPPDVPAHAVRYMQARCWESLGDYDSAIVFMRDAERLTPEYSLSLLLLLKDAGKGSEAVEFSHALIGRTTPYAEDLYFAALTLLEPVRFMNESQAGSAVPPMIHALERSRSLLRQGRLSDLADDPTFPATVAGTLAFCHDIAGDQKKALELYGEAIEANPRAGDWYAERGLIRLRSDRKAAFLDFKKAIDLNGSQMLPWHLLARKALIEGAYGEALRLALQAEQRGGSSHLRAEVYETIAIAQTHLAQPVDWILENFRKAYALDPANDRIRANYGIAMTLPTADARKPARNSQLAIEDIDARDYRKDRMSEVGNRTRYHRKTTPLALRDELLGV